MYKAIWNHEEIKDWVESKGGEPAIIDAPDAGSDKVGLRIDFPGLADEALLARAKPSKKVTWDEFFKVFESQKLAFVIDSQSRGSDWSSVYRFIKRKNLNNSERSKAKEAEQEEINGAKVALDVTQTLPGENPQVGLKDNRLEPSLRGATGNKTLNNNASPEETDEQWYDGDNADPVSDDDVMEVVKEVGLHPDQTQDED